MATNGSTVEASPWKFVVCSEPVKTTQVEPCNVDGLVMSQLSSCLEVFILCILLSLPLAV